MSSPIISPKKQHLIDPGICIRCGTCEVTCTKNAVSHGDLNYVVDADKCDFCMDCIAPCPTGSIDHWRLVTATYSVAEQLGWEELPPQQEFGEDVAAAIEAVEADVEDLLATAHAGSGGKLVAPASAAKPSVNIFSRAKPATAMVQGNYRITSQAASCDVRHIVLSFGSTPFPVLEGQSIGIVPPGTQPNGRPHDIRLYSVASPRDGEKRNGNNVSLTVKRQDRGVASNYLCDLKVGERVQVTGPFGATFLMPGDPSSNILMICTGTGAAPFRAFTERRRRAAPGAPGRMVMFFGARTPGELPYFGPLQKVSASLLERYLVFSRLPDHSKEYVQDRMRSHSERIGDLLRSDHTHVFICGLKGMEQGVDAAFKDICDAQRLNWDTLKSSMRASGRYHIETY